MKKVPLIYHLAHHLLSVSLSFILLLLALTLFDYNTSAKSLPETDLYIQELKLQLDKNPEDQQLVNLIRNLDFVYRKGWFEQRERLDLGIKLTLIGVGAFLLSIIIIFSMQKNLPELKHLAKDERHKNVRHYYITILVLLVIGSLIFFIHQEKESSSNITTKTEKTHVDYLTEAQTQWASFRGGALPTKVNLPASLNLQEAWKTKIPLPGFNSPVIWNDKLFLTGADNKKRTLYCYDINTGKQLWSVDANGVNQLPEVTDDTGYAAPTCAVNDQFVYAIFATGQVLCVDHNGSKKWEQLLPKLDIMYGYASSLLLTQNGLIIQQDGDNHQSIFALDLQSGRTLWRTQRETLAGWSTPILVNYEDQSIIFTTNNKSAEAFDLKTGKTRWRKDCLGGEVATSAYYSDSYIYFANQGAIATAFHPLTGDQLFSIDNVLMPDVASVITYNQLMLLCTSGGSVMVLDAKTGEEKYEHSFETGFYASPLIIDNKVVTINMQGDLLVSTPNAQKWEVIGEYKLGKNVVATPAFKNQRIFIRTFDNELLALEVKP